MTTPFQFDDGGGYERYMGVWSQRVGHAFLDWLAPAPALRWLDVGCGNGAFTELLATRCAPASLHGIDPSSAQLAFARKRPLLATAEFREADAMALPFPDDAFDAAVMPLVIFFVPEPARGVAEMARVVRAGGMVTAYSWDMEGGGFPYAPLRTAMRDIGLTVRTEPNPEASRLDALEALWAGAGLTDIVTHAITVERTFENFDDYWSTIHLGPSVGPTLRAMTREEGAALRARLMGVLPADAEGRITCTARAHAVRGRVGRP